MKFLNVSVTPQKNFKSGNYPVYNESNLICRNDFFNLPGGTGTGIGIGIGTGRTSQLQQDEEYIDGSVCGIRQTINGQTGLNWYQETTYGAYANPVYWSGTYSTKNVWQRSGDTLIFNIYELPSGLLIDQQVFSVEALLKANKFKSSCSSSGLVSVDNVSNVVTFYQDVTLPPNEFPTSGQGVIKAGTYDLNSAPGNYCLGIPAGTIELARWANWRYLLGTTGIGTGSACLLAREKIVLGGCPEFWANTGAYSNPPNAWNLCQDPGVLVPACTTCG